MTETEKELKQAKHRLEEAQARERVKMRWVGLMNNLHSAAEEIVMKELVHERVSLEKF